MFFKHKRKKAVIMKHAVKAVKDKNVHLEITNCQCKLLTSSFEEIFSIIQVYLYTQSPSKYADRYTNMINFFTFPSYIWYDESWINYTQFFPKNRCYIHFSIIHLWAANKLNYFICLVCMLLKCMQLSYPFLLSDQREGSKLESLSPVI